MTNDKKQAPDDDAATPLDRSKEAAFLQISTQIDRLKKKREEKPRRNVSGGHLGLAYRLTIEMFAAIAVCGYLGWWIDRAFETKPIFLMVLLILGVIAGLLNAVRTAASLQFDGDHNADDHNDDDQNGAQGSKHQ